MSHLGFGLGLLVLGLSPVVFFINPAHDRLCKIIVRLARLAVILGWIAVVSSIVYFVFFFSPLGGSKDDVLFQRSSPNKTYIATGFYRIGGATVTNSTVVSMRFEKNRLNTKGDAIVFFANGIRKVKVRWLTDKHLSIAVDSTGALEKSIRWNDVSISYDDSENAGGLDSR